MKLKINHFSTDVFKEKLKHISHVDFSLLVDSTIDKPEDSSPINILVLQEPNEYFGLHDYAIQNKDLFSFILTWDEKVLNNCENAIYFPFGSTWLKPEQYENVNYEKKFELTHLRGNLRKTYGHELRHELLDREKEIKGIPTKFFPFYGQRYPIEKARMGKQEVFAPSQFGVAIENVSHRNYFTEKIIDLFLLKTIPIYWGCSNIDQYFNSRGIIEFKNVDDLIWFWNLTNWEKSDFYNHRKLEIEENYQKALQYIDYEQRIADIINKIFKENNLI